MKKVDERRIEDLLSQLTLEENQYDTRSYVFHSGGVLGLVYLPKDVGWTMGVRKEFAYDSWINVGTTDLVSYLPVIVHWHQLSRDLAYKTGKVLGAEAVAEQDVILALNKYQEESPMW